MKTKERFIKPAILREVSLESEGRILGGSIVEQVTIESAGQTYVDIDTEKDVEWSEKWEW